MFQSLPSGLRFKHILLSKMHITNIQTTQLHKVIRSLTKASSGSLHKLHKVIRSLTKAGSGSLYTCSSSPGHRFFGRHFQPSLNVL